MAENEFEKVNSKGVEQLKEFQKPDGKDVYAQYVVERDWYIRELDFDKLADINKKHEGKYQFPHTLDDPEIKRVIFQTVRKWAVEVINYKNKTDEFLNERISKLKQAVVVYAENLKVSEKEIWKEIKFVVEAQAGRTIKKNKKDIAEWVNNTILLAGAFDIPIDFIKDRVKKE